MIASLALRAGPSARAIVGARAPDARPKRSQAHRASYAARAQTRSHVEGRSRARSRHRPRPASITWEVRTFVAAAAAIAAGFVLAVLYLTQVTGLAAGGYETQRLASARAEGQRQVALLEVRVARLDSPARIAAAATRLGLVRVPHIAVIQAPQLAATR